MRTVLSRFASLLMIAGAIGPSASHAQAQVAPADSIVASVRQRLALCDSQFAELTFVSMLTERELQDDGTTKSEKVSKTRHFVRGEETCEVLEAMWEDGTQVSESTLNEEREKRDKEWAKKKKRIAEGKDDEASRSATILEPFRPAHKDNYKFPEATVDTIGDLVCWRIAVEPTREDEELIKGHVWVELPTGRALREEYDMAKRPGPVKDFGIVMVHEPVTDECAFPSLFQLHVRGKALFFIKFNVDVELRLDSLQLNTELPDSLFADPTE